jgi:hypothetical protein
MRDVSRFRVTFKCHVELSRKTSFLQIAVLAQLQYDLEHMGLRHLRSSRRTLLQGTQTGISLSLSLSSLIDTALQSPAPAKKDSRALPPWASSHGLVTVATRAATTCTWRGNSPAFTKPRRSNGWLWDCGIHGACPFQRGVGDSSRQRGPTLSCGKLAGVCLRVRYLLDRRARRQVSHWHAPHRVCSSINCKTTYLEDCGSSS